jgi:hypothetical protein
VTAPTRAADPVAADSADRVSGPDVGALPHDCLPETLDAGTDRPHAGGRLVGLDAARGLALLGMFAVHIYPAGTQDGDVSLPWALASGRSSALFAVLAGMGLAFMTGRRRRVTVGNLARRARVPVIRGALITLVGLLLGAAVGTELLLVILPYLGVMFVLTVPLLMLGPRMLIALWAAWCVAGPVASHWLRRGTELPDTSNLTVPEVIAGPGEALTTVLLSGHFPAITWMAYLCLGVGVGRLELGSRRVAALLTAAGILVATSAAVLSTVLLGPMGVRDTLADKAMATMSLQEFTSLLMWGGDGTAPTDSWWWLVTAAPHSGTPLDLVHTSGVALAVLGGCLMVAQAFHGGLGVLAVPGSMTLTLYTAHALLLPLTAARWAAPTELTVHVAALTVFAILWHRRLPRGPMEGAVWWAASGVFDQHCTRGRHRPGPTLEVGG